jgi:hypothetical protein
MPLDHAARVACFFFVRTVAFIRLEKNLCCATYFWSQSDDHELQRLLGKNLQHHGQPSAFRKQKKYLKK